MPISWRIAEGLVRLESGEGVSFEEWRSAIEAFSKDPRYRPGMPVLHDRRKRTISLAVSEVEARATYLLQHAAMFGPTRWAAIVARDVEYGMGRMEQALLEGAHDIQLKLFRDPGEAERWARGDGGDA